MGKRTAGVDKGHCLAAGGRSVGAAPGLSLARHAEPVFLSPDMEPVCQQVQTGSVFGVNHARTGGGSWSCSEPLSVGICRKTPSPPPRHVCVIISIDSCIHDGCGQINIADNFD